MKKEKGIPDYIWFISHFYKDFKINFISIVEGFDNIVYNLMLPICKYYGNALFKLIQHQKSVIKTQSFMDNAAQALLDLLYNLSYKTLWEEYINFVLSLPEEHNEMIENVVNELFVSTFDSNKFFSKYPVLARILCNASDVLTNKYNMIYEFLTQDIAIGY